MLHRLRPAATQGPGRLSPPRQVVPEVASRSSGRERIETSGSARGKAPAGPTKPRGLSALPVLPLAPRLQHSCSGFSASLHGEGRDVKSSVPTHGGEDRARSIFVGRFSSGGREYRRHIGTIERDRGREVPPVSMSWPGRPGENSTPTWVNTRNKFRWLPRGCGSCPWGYP
jgi:hypothetical protein